MAKRIFDFFLVIGTAPIWLGLTLFVSVLVRWKIGSPVFYRQERPGFQGRPFCLIKFRTMTDERDAVGNLLPDGQRLTGLGRLLRATSLDELPELLNVLKGEMSLVGPRPLLMEYLPRYTAAQARRHEVKPGLTGWAQVNGRNAISWEQKFILDAWYVEHCNLWLDLKILVLTVIQVFRHEGISAHGHATMPVFHGKGTPSTGESFSKPSSQTLQTSAPILPSSK
ncbi:MAG TPA: sugar transferase [Verrucomicrobiae bacterium]|jgi:lipopolysaccharide/colanic/teichoic acid biosynthesis glycosyltransferase